MNAPAIRQNSGLSQAGQHDWLKLIQADTDNLALFELLHQAEEKLKKSMDSTGAGARKRRGQVTRDVYQALAQRLEAGESLQDFSGVAQQIPPMLRDALLNRMHQGLDGVPGTFTDLLLFRARYLSQPHNEGEALGVRAIWIDTLINAALRLRSGVKLSTLENTVDRVVRFNASPSEAWDPANPQILETGRNINLLLTALFSSNNGASVPLSTAEVAFSEFLRARARECIPTDEDIRAAKSTLIDLMRARTPLAEVQRKIDQIGNPLRLGLARILGGALTEPVSLPSLFDRHLDHLHKVGRLSSLTSPLPYVWSTSLLHAQISIKKPIVLSLAERFVDQKLRIDWKKDPAEVWSIIAGSAIINPAVLSKHGQFLFSMFEFRKPIKEAIAISGLDAGCKSAFTVMIIGLAQGTAADQLAKKILQCS